MTNACGYFSAVLLQGPTGTQIADLVQCAALPHLRACLLLVCLRTDTLAHRLSMVPRVRNASILWP